MIEPLNIVLITSGLRRIAHFFPELSGKPVGIINWSDSPSTHANRFVQNEWTRRLYAKLQRRQFANLPHLCARHNLRYANLYKKDGDALKRTLQDWECNLVITSNCSFVPTDALAHLSHGAINMHPSRLPDYRGAEPLLWQLAAAEPTLATTIHRLADQFDCGDIVAQASIARPPGANRDTLADLTETRLGKPLLNKAIDLLAADPAYKGKVQPEKSATPYAYRKSSDEFGNQFSLTQFTSNTVWDLIQYFGQCPSPWLDNSILQKKLVWVPTQLQDVSKASIVDQHPISAANAQRNVWQIYRHGFTTRLIYNNSTQIILKPRWRSFVGLSGLLRSNPPMGK